MRGLVLILLVFTPLLGGCNAPAPMPDRWLVPGGNVARGRASFEREGCGSCHATPEWSGSRGTVGPSLEGMARRSIVAGMLPNTPENLMRWVADPQSLIPGNAMPTVALRPAELRDIAAYLYSLD